MPNAQTEDEDIIMRKLRCLKVKTK